MIVQVLTRFKIGEKEFRTMGEASQHVEDLLGKEIDKLTKMSGHWSPKHKLDLLDWLKENQDSILDLLGYRFETPEECGIERTTEHLRRGFESLPVRKKGAPLPYLSPKPESPEQTGTVTKSG